MNAMSAVEVENKNYTINQLNSWQNQLLPMDSIDKKIKIVNDNLLLLEYMIKVWKYVISITWTNCPTIMPNPNIVLQSMVVMLQNDISKKNIA
jgi:hypothetical protein